MPHTVVHKEYLSTGLATITSQSCSTRGSYPQKGEVMHCPYCRHEDSRVIDSRTQDDGGAIRRRRQCPECSRRFSTIETAMLLVAKRSGAVESFSRAKVIAGVRKSCQGRPVNDDDLARLAQQVEDALRAAGAAEVPSQQVGLAILGPLRELDEIAYLRFASVYRDFESLEDFEGEIAVLRAAKAVTSSGVSSDELHSESKQLSAT